MHCLMAMYLNIETSRTMGPRATRLGVSKCGVGQRSTHAKVPLQHPGTERPRHPAAQLMSGQEHSMQPYRMQHRGSQQGCSATLQQAFQAAHHLGTQRHILYIIKRLQLKGEMQALCLSLCIIPTAPVTGKTTPSNHQTWMASSAIGAARSAAYRMTTVAGTAGTNARSLNTIHKDTQQSQMAMKRDVGQCSAARKQETGGTPQGS